MRRGLAKLLLAACKEGDIKRFKKFVFGDISAWYISDCCSFGSVLVA